MPAASPSLARSTNRRVRSSGLSAFSLSGTGVLSFVWGRLSTVSLDPSTLEVQQILLLEASITRYGTQAARILHRARRSTELHARGRARAHKPVRRQRPDPAARAGARRHTHRPVRPHRHTYTRRSGGARARQGRTRIR